MNLSDSLTGDAAADVDLVPAMRRVSSVDDLLTAWAGILSNAAAAAARARTPDQVLELATLGHLLAAETDPGVWASLLSSLHTAVVEASGQVLAESAADELWTLITADVDVVERTWAIRGAVDAGLAELCRTIADGDAVVADARMRRHLDVFVPELAGE